MVWRWTEYIGAQDMPANSGDLFDLEHSFCRYFPATNPRIDRLVPNTYRLRDPVRPELLYHFLCFGLHVGNSS